MGKKPKIIEISLDEKAGTSSLSQNVKTRLSDVENQTKAIYWVGVIALIGIIVAAFAMFLDQVQFNNQTYRDQSRLNELKFEEVNQRMKLLEQQNSKQ